MVADCTAASSVAPAVARTRCGSPTTVIPCRASAVAKVRAAMRDGLAAAGRRGPSAADDASPSAVIGPIWPVVWSLLTHCGLIDGPLKIESSKPIETRCVPASFNDAAVWVARSPRPAWP